VSSCPRAPCWSTAATAPRSSTRSRWTASNWTRTCHLSSHLLPYITGYAPVARSATGLEATSFQEARREVAMAGDQQERPCQCDADPHHLVRHLTHRCIAPKGSQHRKENAGDKHVT
jgi:hypothetical protein